MSKNMENVAIAARIQSSAPTLIFDLCFVVSDPILIFFL